MGSSQSKREQRKIAETIGFGRRIEHDCIKAAIAANKQQRKLLMKQAKQANIQPSTLMFRNSINPLAQDQLYYQPFDMPGSPGSLSISWQQNNHDEQNNHYLNEEELNGKREIFNRFERQHRQYHRQRQKQQKQKLQQHQQQPQQVSENYHTESNEIETYYIPGNGLIDKRYVSHNLLTSKNINSEEFAEEEGGGGELNYYYQPSYYTNHKPQQPLQQQQPQQPPQRRRRLKGAGGNSNKNNKRKMFSSHAGLLEETEKDRESASGDVSTIQTQGALRSLSRKRAVVAAGSMSNVTSDLFTEATTTNVASGPAFATNRTSTTANANFAAVSGSAVASASAHSISGSVASATTNTASTSVLPASALASASTSPASGSTFASSPSPYSHHYPASSSSSALSSSTSAIATTLTLDNTTTTTTTTDPNLDRRRNKLQSNELAFELNSNHNHRAHIQPLSDNQDKHQLKQQQHLNLNLEQLTQKEQQQRKNQQREREQLHNNNKQFNYQAFDYITNKLEMMNISPRYQRGLAFTEDERKKLGLKGHLPAAYQDQELQVKGVMNFIETCQDELSKYVYLRNLKDFNENLFYAALMKNVEKLMPLVYTPTVGLACQKFSQIYMKPRGLFITSNDQGKINSILANWPEKDVRVIVVTDGERILGLGDLGANGMGISIGKLSLYTALAGIPPQNVLPVTIDVGTNNEFNLKDPFYIGLRQNRVRGEKYDALIEEFMQSVVARWGKSCLIQFEDFANSTAFNLLQRYRDKYCTFNDDIQGTASVCLSGLLSASKLINRKISDCSFLFYGAGEANLGTANLVIMAMIEEGASREQAKKNIFLIDSKGLVVKSRTDLSHHKEAFAQDAPQIKQLEDIIDFVKPVAIIGASAQGKAFTESICKKMASFNERPIIFALSNPTSKAECTAEEAYRWTNGKCVFASGSPFDPVVYNGKTYITGQGNNAYIFPGVGLAAIAAHVHTVPEEAFLIAARALSDQLTSSDTSVGLVYPRLTKIREVTLAVATRVLEYFYTERLATYRPEPDDKVSFLKSIQYDSSYELLLPEQNNKISMNQMSLNNNGRVNGN